MRYLLFLTGLGGEVGVGAAIRDHMGGSLIDRGEVGKEMVSRGDNQHFYYSTCKSVFLTMKYNHRICMWGGIKDHQI